MVVFNHGRGRWWRILRRERGGEVWGQQQLIEHPVDSPCPRKLELVPCRPYLLLDHEGSHTFVVQLLGGAVHLQVLCVQPDQVPLGILMTWALSHIIAFLHRDCHFLHHFPSCSLGLHELGHPLVSCWVHLRRQVDSSIPEMPPILKEEWGLSSRRVLV